MPEVAGHGPNSDECVDGCCVNTSNYPTANAGLDRTISADDSVEIGGSTTGSGGTPPYTYSWSPDTELNDPTAANPTASPSTTTTYTVTVTDVNGCSDTDSMTVTVTTITRGAGPAAISAGCHFDVDMLGEMHRIVVRCCDRTAIKDYLPSDPVDEQFLSIDVDTLVVCGDCEDCRNNPEVIVMSLADSWPLPDNVLVSPVFDITGYDRHGEPCNAVVFDKPGTVILDYDPGAVPEDASGVFVAYCDSAKGYWEPLPPDTGRVAAVGEATGRFYRIGSLFAVMAEVAPPTSTVQPNPSPSSPPANFEVNNLTILPSQRKVQAGKPFVFMVRTGENVTITADVVNSGGQEGDYTANLEINGQIRDSKEITLQPGQGQGVSFTVTNNEPGDYVVEIGSATGEYSSTLWLNWWLIGGIIAAFAVLGWGLWYRRRRLRS